MSQSVTFIPASVMNVMAVMMMWMCVAYGRI